MNKKNGGFTLIELMIAIAVLSIMVTALFQVFIVSRRIDTKAGAQEALRNIAGKTMEDLKSCSFAELKSQREESGEETGEITIGGNRYSYEPLEEGQKGYLLKREGRMPGRDPSQRADYLIYAEVDYGKYAADGDDEGETYSVNNYRMPNIADVSSYTNVVFDPLMLHQNDEIWMGELLGKVNPREEEEGGEGGEPEAGDTEGDAGDSEEEAEIIYQEEDIRKYLHIELKEEPEKNNKLIARAYAAYTVSEDGFDPWEGEESDSTVMFHVASIKRTVETDEISGKALNRIYAFLPSLSQASSQTETYERVYVTADVESIYELYVILPEDVGGISEADFIKTEDKRSNGVESSLELYTNIGGRKPVSLYEAENRLFDLTVTVYKAKYLEFEEGEEPVRGEELLRMDSTSSP